MESKKARQYKDLIESSPEQSPKDSTASISTSKEKQLANDPLADSASMADTNGVNFLGSLLHATIFFDYFEYIANKTYRGDNIEMKVVKLKSVHPLFHTACIILDTVIVTIAVILLIIAAAGAAYKVIWG